MTTILAALALSSPLGEELTVDNAVLHTPVIAPYSELILFHTQIESQPTNHGVWLIAEGGKARRVAPEAVNPLCLGVLPNDPVAIVADHAGPSERYQLAHLRSGAVTKLPDFGLSVQRALTDQLNRNMLLVARDADGALGLYRFAVESWYRATEEQRAEIKPVLVWPLESPPQDLVFGRDGGRIALREGMDIRVVTLGESVTSKKWGVPGKTMHPRDFHPTKNLLLYESTCARGGLGPLGEVGIFDMDIPVPRTAFYFAEELSPNKDPRFDASGKFIFVDLPTETFFDSLNDESNKPSRIQSRPRPVPFAYSLAGPEVSLMLYGYRQGPIVETGKPIFVHASLERTLIEQASLFARPQREFQFQVHGLNVSRVQRWVGSNGNGTFDYFVEWRTTSAFSPTASGQYVDLTTAQITGETNMPDFFDDNYSEVLRFDANHHPWFKPFGRDGITRDGLVRQGDVRLDSDVMLFDAPWGWDDRVHWATNYPNWSHYGSP